MIPVGGQVVRNVWCNVHPICCCCARCQKLLALKLDGLQAVITLTTQHDAHTHVIWRLLSKPGTGLRRGLGCLGLLLLQGRQPVA